MKNAFMLGLALALSAAATTRADPPPAARIATIAEFGKAVDWHHGLDRIASARLGKDGYYDVFTMKPDGSDLRVLTEDLHGCPQKHNGNACFHPSGEFLVFTGEDERMPDETDMMLRRIAVPGSGFGANLFIMDVNGQTCRQLTSYPLTRPIRAVIHPQFSHDGKKLAWAERVKRGDSFGGGWVMKLADFENKDSTRLTNTKTLTPGMRDCFYETHGFSADGKRLLFSGNLQEGQPHTGLDIYELNIESGGLKRLTHSHTDWDEHAHYSPDGKKIAWMSSSGFDIDYGPEKGQGTTWGEHLKTELWIMNAAGSDAAQLTHFNTPGFLESIENARCIVSDSAWVPVGKSICACVAWFKGGEHGVRLVRISLQ